MKKLIILLLFIPYMFTSCVDVNRNIIGSAILVFQLMALGLCGWYQGEWKITSREK